MSEAPETARRRALARDADEETRYRAVAALDPERPDERSLLLDALGDTSWRVRSAAVERLATAADAAPALVETLARGPGVGAREAAGAALSRIGPATVPALVERLGAADPDLRQAVASVLAEIADPRAVPALTARLADPDPNVRGAAAEALAKIGGRAALDALRAAAESDDPTLRLSAVEGLVELRASVAPALLERLLADRGLRRPAYRLLGECDDDAALPLIGRGLCEPARAAREGALAALGQQRARRPPEAVAPLLRDAAAAAARDPALADAWAAALASPDPLVAQGAVTVLAAAGAARHVAALLRLAEDERLRPLVVDALEALPPGAELREALAAALPSLGRLARLAALAALARGGSAAAFEALVREASDPDGYEAIAALGRVGDARAVGPLAGLLADDAPAAAGLASTALLHLARRDGATRAAVLAALRARAAASPSAALYRTLGVAGGHADLARLRAGLRADAAAHRAAAAGALAAFAGRGLLEPEVAAELADASRDGAWQVRSAAARALAAAGAGGSDGVRAEARAALRAALRDAEPMVCAAAAEALGACGDGEDVGELAELVRDPDAAAPVVMGALRALAALGSAPPDVVLRAVSHPDPEVVKEAVHAAARLAAPEGVAVLLEAAASPRWDVRQAAARAMRASGAAALASEAARLAASEADPLVAQAFAEAARALGAR